MIQWIDVNKWQNDKTVNIHQLIVSPLYPHGFKMRLRKTGQVSSKIAMIGHDKYMCLTGFKNTWLIPLKFTSIILNWSKYQTMSNNVKQCQTCKPSHFLPFSKSPSRKIPCVRRCCAAALSLGVGSGDWGRATWHVWSWSFESLPGAWTWLEPAGKLCQVSCVSCLEFWPNDHFSEPYVTVSLKKCQFDRMEHQKQLSHQSEFVENRWQKGCDVETSYCTSWPLGKNRQIPPLETESIT